MPRYLQGMVGGFVMTSLGVTFVTLSEMAYICTLVHGSKCQHKLSMLLVMRYIWWVRVLSIVGIVRAFLAGIPLRWGWSGYTGDTTRSHAGPIPFP